MDHNEINLLTAFKTSSAYGVKYAVDFPAASVGGQQFAIVTAAVPTTATQAATQSSGAGQIKAGVKSKATTYKLLHDDLAAITGAAHSLVLLGVPGLNGKFHMPRNHGAQDMLNSARAFATDAVPFSAQFISVGLAANFIAQLNTDIAGYETAIAAKGTGAGVQGGATAGIEDTSHKAAVALHILNTVVPNTYRNNPQRLAEWAIASHVEKHASAKHPPVTPPTPTPTPTPPVPPVKPPVTPPSPTTTS